MPTAANNPPQSIVDNEQQSSACNLNPEIPIKVEKIKKFKKEKSEKKIVRIQRRDPVYDLFTFNDDPNIAKCEQENCSAKLVVSVNRKSFSKQLKFSYISFQRKATTLKRHLQRFHKNVYDILTKSSNQSSKALST